MSDLPILGNAPLKQPALVNTNVAGFRAAAVSAGLRKDGREDLALIAADTSVAGAGLFTKNKLPAAPVIVSRKHLVHGFARAILANCGGANAATGEAGIEACLSTCSAAAAELNCLAAEVLPCSTGVIGQLLPADKINRVMPELARNLSPQGLPEAAKAIMTTDAFPKMAERKIMIMGQPVSIVGMAKGAGMIRPDMATMLCFILTDAAASPAALSLCLNQAAEQSFHRATVDGDTSTNDTVLLLASAKAEHKELIPGSPELAILALAITGICQDLAAMLVADGEGAQHLVRIRVSGAVDQDQARAYCFSIGHSPLCKTAFNGCDPNWGRLASTLGAEAGRRQWPFAPDKLSLWFNEEQLLKHGQWQGAHSEARVAQIMKQPRYEIRLDLSLGSEEYWILTSDLGHEYVNINADYRS